jgi:hypothetical protein
MGSPSCFMEKKFIEGQKGDDITPFDGTRESGGVFQYQCCGSGFRIWCLFDSWTRDPGWVKNRSRIRDEQSRSYFRELRNQYFGFQPQKLVLA